MSAGTPVWIRRGACFGLPSAWWFPVKAAGESTSAALAKATCRVCPVRVECITAALEVNEEHGIWGGAGEARRRALRRARAAGQLGAALAAHWRALDGVAAVPGDRELLAVYGEGATHGRASTYAKSCRCAACELAASIRTAHDKRRSRGRKEAA